MQTITLEKRLAPAAGGNFSFGLGIGVAAIVERKTNEAFPVPADSGNGYLAVHRIDVDFEGWQFG